MMMMYDEDACMHATYGDDDVDVENDDDDDDSFRKAIFLMKNEPSKNTFDRSQFCMQIALVKFVKLMVMRLICS